MREGSTAVGIYQIAGEATSTDMATNQGGPTIGDVSVQLIFWGRQWRNSNTSPSAGDITAAANRIFAGPYLSQMSQYGYRSIRLRGVTVDTGSDPPRMFQYSDISDHVWDMIDNGQFPEPDDDGGRILYMVLMPPGANPAPTGNPPSLSCGSHGAPVDHDFLIFDAENAWVGWAFYGASLNDITKVFTHELVEAIGDPDPDNAAWKMNRQIHNGDEIGDACNFVGDLVDGLEVQAYWSQKHRACVIPLGSGRPEIQGVSANEGPVDGGTRVVITGRFLANAQSVYFGALPAARFTVDSMTQITAVTPAFDTAIYSNAQRVLDIRVTTPYGTSAENFTFKFDPVVTGVSPSYGRMSGGTTVTITGRGFAPGRVSDVSFGPNNLSPNVYCYDTTTCVVASPPSGPGLVDVIVNVGGAASLPVRSDRFTYSGPTISRMTPFVGPDTGGTYVDLYGISFESGMKAFFGLNQSPYVVCTDDTRCRVRSPRGSGTVDVWVEVNGVPSTPGPFNRFTYAAFPSITSISPVTGPATGGAIVTIAGTNFNPGATRIAFGASASASVNCTPVLCTAVAPPGIGIVDVTATVNGFTSVTVNADQFIYAPVVAAISPASGPESGGTTITITGAGFDTDIYTPTSRVTFGAGAPIPVICATPATCTVTSPAGSNIVDVRVGSFGQISAITAADQFIYKNTGVPKGWSQWHLQSGPSGRGGGVAYDPARRQLLYFAPEDDSGPTTWILNAGASGWQRSWAAVNPDSTTAAFAFYDVNSTAVWFGGIRRSKKTVFTDDTTWVWNGVDWTTPLSPLAVRPPARFSASLVMDAAHQRLVLFGGCSKVDCSTRLNDTWTWDGLAWRQEAPPQSPPSRDAAAMAYNPAIGRVILFGGRDANGPLGDLWSWDGLNWTPLAVIQPAPVSRSGANLTYSPADSGLLLYGGLNANGYLDDTWIWTGASWRQVPTTLSPGAANAAGMTYNAAARAIVLGDATWIWGGQ